VTESLWPEDIRASDVDRKHTQDRLHRAHAEGLISLEEFDSRVHAAWQAKTRGELAKVSADLPAYSTTRTPRGAFAPGPGGTAMRVLFAIWLGLSVVNVVIWALAMLSIGEWVSPWWVWITVPSGAALGTLWMVGIGRRRE
jgi:Domain of unknown function (DUF1707)